MPVLLSGGGPEPIDAHCASRLRSLLLLRLGALAGQVLAYAFASRVLGLSVPILPLALIGVGLLMYTLITLRRQGSDPGAPGEPLLKEVVIDLAALTGSLYLTGGSHNPLMILLLLPMTVAAAALPPRQVWGITALAAVCYTALMFFHLDFPVLHPGLSGFYLHVQGMWYGFILSAVLIAYFAAQMGAALRATEQDLTERKRMEEELHQLSARILSIQEEERARVARDLHDGLCQSLTAMRLVLEGCLGDGFPAERRAPMSTLRSLVPAMRGAVDEVRRISTALRPAMLDDLGLLATIRWHLGEIEKRVPDLEVRRHLDAAEADIPEDLKTPIFRILQEATHNAVKHGGGSALEVRLTADEGRLRLTVQDNGSGFVLGEPGSGSGPAGHPGYPGLGLSSMRERAEISGGVFRLLTRPGEGTTCEASWRLTDSLSG